MARDGALLTRKVDPVLPKGTATNYIKNSAERFCKVLEIMREAGVNIEYSYSILLKNSEAGFIFEVDDSAKASEALNNAGIHVITQEELQTL